jgi:hypothetical protein
VKILPDVCRRCFGFPIRRNFFSPLPSKVCDTATIELAGKDDLGSFVCRPFSLDAGIEISRTYQLLSSVSWDEGLAKSVNANEGRFVTAISVFPAGIDVAFLQLRDIQHGIELAKVGKFT